MGRWKRERGERKERKERKGGREMGGKRIKIRNISVSLTFVIVNSSFHSGLVPITIADLININKNMRSY